MALVVGLQCAHALIGGGQPRVGGGETLLQVSQRSGIERGLFRGPRRGLLVAVGLPGDRAPRGFLVAGLGLGFLVGGIKAGAQHRHDGLDLLVVAALRQHALLDLGTTGRQPHEAEQEGAALVRLQLGEPLRVQHVGQRRRRHVLGQRRGFAVRQGDKGADGAVDLDFGEAGFSALGDQLAVVLFQADAHRFAGERHADGFLQAGLSRAVLASEQRHGLGQLDFHGASTEEVLHTQAGEFHAASPPRSSRSSPCACHHSVLCSWCHDFQPLTHSMHSAPFITGHALWSFPSWAASLPSP